MMRTLNKKGSFSNFDDDLEGLARELHSRFAGPTVKVVGTVALFSARV